MTLIDSQAVSFSHPLGLSWTTDTTVQRYAPIFGEFERSAAISLPKDALFEIFTHLNDADLFSAIQVNTMWQLLIGAALFDPRTGFNIFKMKYKPDPTFIPLEKLVALYEPERAVMRAAQVFTAIRLAKKKMSEIEYTWTTTDFMLKEILTGERTPYSVKREKFPELFVKTITPASQLSVRASWTSHIVLHSKWLK